ncbi:MAG: VWA domain-containing protein [Vicinamibacterales bacterium]
MTRFRTLQATAALAVAAVLVAASGQPPAPQAAAQAPAPQAPAFRSGVDLVTVDVTVLSRGGEPVDSLKAGDFTLLVDGAPRPIVSVRLVEASRGLAPDVLDARPDNAPVPAVDTAARRRFVLVVDRDHIYAGEGQQMLQAAAKFIDGLAPGDSVALWTLPDSSTALRFGEDREEIKRRLRRAVGTYRAVYGPWVVGRDEAIQTESPQGQQVLASIIARECDRQPPTCPDQVAAQARQTAMDARERADASIAQLGPLVDALGKVEGPKHLVLITGGPVTTIENIRDVAALGRRAGLARVTIHALQIHDPSYRARTDQMRAMPADIEQTTSAAYQLAATTGGLALTPTSGEIGFERLDRELSAGYMLVFETSPMDRDGKEHEISVKVRDQGWGGLVRARKYFRVDPNAVAPEAGPAPAAAPAPPPPPEPVGVDPGDMADRLADYAELFEREIAAVVAEERYVQIIHPWRGNPSGPQGEPALTWREPGDKAKQGGPIIARRQLLSDVVMVQLKERQWLAYRDVAEVDGSPVRDRTDRVQDLLLSRAADRDDQFRRVNLESARYNLGDLRREMNLPTVTLSLLRRQNQARFQFKRGKDDTIGGRVCRVLGYQEKAVPTLIGTPKGGDIFVYGRVWIDQADGRVRRTELRFERRSQGRSYIRVDYGTLEGLPILVPALMWEWYEGGDQLGRIGGDVTAIQGLATYGKVRRFQVTTAEDIK